MNKIIHALTLTLFLISANAFASSEIKKETNDFAVKNNDLLNSLEIKISSLNSSINALSKKQQRLSKAIDGSRSLQEKINLTASNLLTYVQNTYSTDKPIPIKISQKTNWYPYLLPLITIFIVLATTFLSLRTIKIKSNESIAALQDSNKTLVNINNKSILEEHERSQKTIITNNRQEWINTLRGEITSFLAVVASTSPSQKFTDISDIEQKNIWLHFYKIQLLLNPNENDHKELVTKIREQINIMISCDEEVLVSEIISISQAILKREWERVKGFEKGS